MKSILAFLLLCLIAIDHCTAQPFVPEPPLGMEMAGDQRQGNEICQFLKNTFPKTKQDNPVFYCSSGTLSIHLTVYEVLTKEKQDKIIELLTQETEKKQWKLIYVIFREKEIFVKGPGGWDERKNERDLRSALIQNEKRRS